MSSKKSTVKKKPSKNDYKIIFPSSGRGLKEVETLLQRRKKQLEKAIEKLRYSPTNFQIKGIEKIDNSSLGQYTIRVSKGDRVFYDVDEKNKRVFILRAGKHDLYRLI